MKMYGPAVLEALCECLRLIYWYHDDLKSFLMRAGVPAHVVSSLPWDRYKRVVVKELVDRLAANPGPGKPILEKLLDAITEQDEEFAHLRRLDDGKRKAEEAQSALQQLRQLLDTRTLAERADRAKQEKRTESARIAALVRERSDATAKLNEKLGTLCSSEDPHRRGLDFQGLLRDLFALYDLAPRGAFSTPGEQLDGSITIDGTVLLVEAKWTKEPTSPHEVRDFRSKVHDKLDNTLGLMISMAGFTEQAIEKAAGGGRMLLVLMDGQDLAGVLQGIDDLVDVLRRKLRHAAEEGSPMYRAGR